MTAMALSTFNAEPGYRVSGCWGFGATARPCGAKAGVPVQSMTAKLVPRVGRLGLKWAITWPKHIDCQLRLNPWWVGATYASAVTAYGPAPMDSAVAALCVCVWRDCLAMPRSGCVRCAEPHSSFPRLSRVAASCVCSVMRHV
jgi:hypothetical protein